MIVVAFFGPFASFVSVCINICFSTGSTVSEVPEPVNAADGAAVSNKLPPQLS